jgi:hypothetical protein
VLGVLGKRRGHRNTERRFLDDDFDAQAAKHLVEPGVEVGDRQPAAHAERPGAAIGGLHRQGGSVKSMVMSNVVPP